MSNVWIAPATDLSKARQITFGSFERLDGWFGLDWLPNGKIAYTAVVEKGKTIFMMDAGGGNQKQLIPNGGENLYPSVSDDNRYLVFQSNRNGRYEVWRADSVTGDLRPVTNVEVAAQPHISPDGKWIVYVSDPKEFGTLYRISSDGGEATRLTEKPAKWARVSPDSKFVACGYYDSGTQKLAIIPISGGEPVRVFDTPPAANLGLGVRWTPDGKAVAYRDWVDGIWMQALNANAPERLKGLPHEKLYAFDWSADGKFLAFTRGTQTRDVVLISAER